MLRSLIRKYGDNIQAMARDHELNVQQLTEAQLRKRIDLFNRTSQITV